MYSAIIMNDIPYVKYMCDFGFKDMSNKLPRNKVHNKNILYLAAENNRIIIFKILLDTSQKHNINIGSLPKSAIKHFSYDIIKIIVQANIKYNDCISATFRMFYNNECSESEKMKNSKCIVTKKCDISVLTDEILHRTIYALQLQDEYSGSDIIAITDIIVSISSNNSIDLVNKFIDIVHKKKIPQHEYMFFTNKVTFPYFANIIPIKLLSKTLKLIIQMKPFSDNIYMFDYYLENKPELCLFIYYHILLYSMHDFTINDIIYIMQKMTMIEDVNMFFNKSLCIINDKITYDGISYADDIYSVNMKGFIKDVGTNEYNVFVDIYEDTEPLKIDCDAIKIILERFDQDTIETFFIKMIQERLPEYISEIVRFNHYKLLKYIDNKYFNKTAILTSYENDIAVEKHCNKYILKAIRYKSWDVKMYLMNEAHIQNNEYHFKYSNFYENNLSESMKLDYNLQSINNKYCENRFGNLIALKYVMLFLINVSEYGTTYKQVKYYEECVSSFNSELHLCDWIFQLFGIIIPYSSELHLILPILCDICKKISTNKYVMNSKQYADIDIGLDTITKSLRLNMNTFATIIRKNIDEYKKIHNTINKCMMRYINKKLEKIVKKHTIFDSLHKIATENNKDVSIEKSTETRVKNTNIFNLIKRAKYPVELEHYQKFYKALELDTPIECYSGQIKCKRSDYTIIIYSTGKQFMKPIKSYSKNIYSSGKDDINHIYDFSIDKYLHAISCHIEYETNNIFLNKPMYRAYFDGTMIINNELIHGSFEYFTNCFGITFHRLFRPNKN
jgi:hypothetical protein